MMVCLAFPIHRGMVTIPKSTNPKRIEENLKATQVKLDAEDMKCLREVDKNSRILTGNIFYTPNQTLESFWDVEEDSKFEVKPPEAKKAKSGEE